MATTRAQRAHECDLIVDALLEKLSARTDLAVDYAEYDEGDAAPQHVPDILLRHARGATGWFGSAPSRRGPR